MDPSAGTVRDGATVHTLSPIEGKLLEHLARRSGEIVGRDELLVEVWGYRPGVRSRTIDNTTGRLRAKIEPDPSEPRYLHSIYGRGLRLDGVSPIAAAVPHPAARFVGRGAALAALAKAVHEGRRLVTVWGPAGVGKSRLVQEVVPQLGREVVRVACALVRDAESFDEAVASALGLAGTRPDLARSLAGLGAAVVVLDECERAAEPIAERIRRWWNEAPRLVVIATSRVALGLDGEQQLPLGPLAPDEAVELFVDRARLRDAAFDAPVDQLEQLVARVDRLPLALELAAARVHLLGVAGMSELLAGSRTALDVLKTPGRASMADVVEHSVQALSAEDRRTLVAASTFEGPFGLDDLEAVAELGRGDALAGVESLVASALLRVVVDGDDRRYTPYAVVRDRARADVDDADPVFVRHARWFSAIGEPDALDRARYDVRQRARLRRAVADLGAAMERSWHLDPDVAARCGLALVWRMAREGPVAAGIALARRLKDLPMSNPTRVALGSAHALSCQMAGDHHQAVAVIEEVLPLPCGPAQRVYVHCTAAVSRRLVGDEVGARREVEAARPFAADAPGVRAVWLQVLAYYQTDRAEGERLILEAAQVARACGDRLTEGSCIALLAHVRERYGEWAGCRRYYQRALDVLGTDDLTLRARATTEMMFGRLERVRGDLDAAERHQEVACDLASRLGNIDTLHTSWYELALSWQARGWVDDARAVIEPVASFTTEFPHKATGWSLLVLAALDETADPRAARAAAVRALEHGREGRWAEMHAEALEWLAVLDGDPSRIAEADAVEPDPGPVVRARRTAVAAAVVAEHGPLDEAESLAAAARAACDELELLPDADPRRWLARAAHRIEIRAGRALPGRFGSAR